MSAAGTAVPACIRGRVDELYQAMAHLNYKSRLTTFPRIFRLIDIMILILRNEEKYRRWHEGRRQRRPASVRVTRLPSLSKSGTPNSSSSALICAVTFDCTV